MKVIDAHVHLVQCIAGTGDGGELRSIGGGKAVYANGKEIQLLPPEMGDQVTPEVLLKTMDENDVEKAVLLQGNYYGFQNLYTHQAVKEHPDRLIGAASYDPFSRDKDGIRHYLFEELKIPIVKFEVSTGSGLMCNHPTFSLNGDLMNEAYSYAESLRQTFVIDIGKCGSESWQTENLLSAIKQHPNLHFVICHLFAPAVTDLPLLKETLQAFALPNVWFDLAALTHNLRPDAFPYPVTANCMVMAKDIVGADHLMFATDFPSAVKRDCYRHYIDMIAESDQFSNEEKNWILHDTAQRVYFDRH